MINEFKQIKDATFKRLKDNIGKEVTCHYYNYGVEFEKVAIIKSVTYYGGIILDGLYLPFIGYDCAVDFIELNETHEIIYSNPRAKSYGSRKQKDISEERAVVFGKELVLKEKQRGEYKEFVRQKSKAQSDKKARFRKSLFTNVGLKYVKEGTEEQWKEYVNNNTQDTYSALVVEATIEMMKLFEKGVSFKDAEDKVFSDLEITLFMSGCVASTLVYFSKYGDEFKVFWNKQNGINDEEAQGVVNPAILTLS